MGLITTEMTAAIPEKVLAPGTATDPRRPGGDRPEEVARVVHFLSADASSDITGQFNGRHGHVIVTPPDRSTPGPASVRRGK
jgi:acetoacetyl-CoA reductase/3-oxoacyl-[acyl-carrier protein] reductase